jgi:hypothetical protein
MGLLSRFFMRSQIESAMASNPATDAGPGVDAAIGSLDALVGQVHELQGTPVPSGQMTAMMANAGEMQKEIMEIVKRHGFDGVHSMQPTDVEGAAEMQREIMEAMSRHGFNVPGMAGALPTAAAPAPPSPDDGGPPIRDPLSGR